MARVLKLYPGEAEEVSTAIPLLLDELLASGRVRRVTVPSERPLLRVAFGGFWETLEPGDNYLIWTLSFRYDVLAVQASSIPDLLFFGPSPEDLPREVWDRERTLGIFCGSGSGVAPAASDFALVWDGSDDEGQLLLPSWVLLVDWRQDLSDHPDLERLAPYLPHRFGERFLAALERHAERQETERQTEQSPHGASPRCRGNSVEEPREGLDEASRHVAESSPSGPDEGPRLTVGMATYDDYDGVYFTVQALFLYHPEIAAELELLIVDNHPGGPASDALKGLAGAVSGGRYVAFAEVEGTSVRDVIFRHARAPIVLCVDSHVLLPPGSLLQLVEYLEERPDCRDLVQGPLLYDDHRTLSTHFNPIWSEGMFGVWETDERGREPGGSPFEIPMQGLGLFACRRQAWPGLNSRFRGFGGEEGYLHEKFRQRGGRTLCLPFLRWLHRFQRPHGLPFSNVWEERIRNYLIGHQELGLPTAGLESHFRAFLGDAIYESAEAATRAEMTSPFWTFDAVYAIDGEGNADRRRRFESAGAAVGLGKLLRWESPPAAASAQTGAAAELTSAFGHRSLLERALLLGFESILVLDPDTPLTPRAVESLAAAVAAVEGREWNVLVIDPGEGHSPRAVAYHRRIYLRICDELSPEPALMAAAIRERGGTFWSYLETVS